MPYVKCWQTGILYTEKMLSRKKLKLKKLRIKKLKEKLQKNSSTYKNIEFILLPENWKTNQQMFFVQKWGHMDMKEEWRKTERVSIQWNLHDYYL